MAAARAETSGQWKMANGRIRWPGLSGTKDGEMAAWHAFELKQWPMLCSGLLRVSTGVPSLAPLIICKISWP